MKLYSDTNCCKLYCGNVSELSEVFAPNSVDSIITDPRFEESQDQATWEPCYKALKPGGYLMVFGYPFNYRRLACAIEDVGFEIRDSLMWLYGHSLGGTSTGLAPMYASIIMARKPCEGTCVDNVLTYGVGGINLDDCRIPFEDTPNPATNPLYRLMNGYKTTANANIGNSVVNFGTSRNETSPLGRFPSNVILTYDFNDYQEVCGGMPYTESNGGTPTMPDLRDVGKKSKENIGIDKLSFGQVRNADRKMQSSYVAPSDSGSAARYFYNAKITSKDTEPMGSEIVYKPYTLLQYIIRMVTPPNGVIVDPFGKFSNIGKAVMYENAERDSGYTFIGIYDDDAGLDVVKTEILSVNNTTITEK